MNNFPIRVNRKDADKHFTNRGFQKKPDAEVKIFSRGARHYLHPALAVLDQVECDLAYYKTHKIMVVSYDPVEENIDHTDYTRMIYGKCVMSGDIDFIVKVIREYIEDKRKQQEECDAAINSDVQTETIDITTEVNPV